MALVLPPVSIPIQGTIAGIQQAIQQAEALVNKFADRAYLVKVGADTANAQQQISSLNTQLAAMQQALNQSQTAANTSKQVLASYGAQAAQLRADIQATIAVHNNFGSSTQVVSQATQGLRTQLTGVQSAMASERAELTATNSVMSQQTTGIARLRNELKSLTDSENSTADATRKRVQAESSAGGSSGGSGGGGGSFFGGLAQGASRTSGLGYNALQQGAIFAAGAVAGQQAANLLISAVGGAKDSIIGFNASLEQSKIAFTTFLGGAQQANDFLNQLQQFAVATPFEFPQLVDAAKKMLAFGFSAQQVIPLLTAVGNAAAGLGSGSEGIDRISLALGQMETKGRISGQELRQLQEAGVSTGEIFDVIAKKTGVSADALKDMASKGTLSAQIFISAFQEWSNTKFGDMMEKQSHTFSGAMSNIHDAVQQVLARVGSPFFNAISNAAQAIAGFTATDKFASWARSAEQAVQSVINIMGQLLHMAADLARALGLPVPHLSDLTGGGSGSGADAAAKAQEQADAANAAAQAQYDSLQQAIAYGKAVEDADTKLKQITVDLGHNKDAQDEIANAIQDTKKGYDDQITAIQRQITAMDQLSDAEKSRNSRLNQIEGQQIQIKLSMPDTSAMDDELEKLKRQKEDLGKFDSSQYDHALDGFQSQLDAIAHEDTKTLQKAIDGVQEQIYQAGLKNTDSIDKQIQSYQDKIDALSTAEIDSLDKQINGLQDQLKSINTDDLDRQIDTLKAKLNEPAPDTSGLANQLAVLAAGLQSGNGTDVARQQYATLSAQKAGIQQNYATAQSGLKGQLALLEAQRTAQKEQNDLDKASIQAQIDGLTKQRDLLKENNDTTKAGYESNIKDLQRQKREIDDQNKAQKSALDAQLHGLEQQKKLQDQDRADRKQAIQDQIDSTNKAKKAAQDAHQAQVDAVDAQITQLQRAKDDLLAPYNAALKRLDAEKNILDLQNQQDALTRKIAEAPLKERIDDLKIAEEDALKPLQDQQTQLARNAQELEKQQRYWQQIKSDATDALQAITNPPPAPPKPPGAGGDGTAPGDFIGPVESTGVEAFLNRLQQKLSDITGSDDWSVVFYGKHKDGTPVSTKERWETAGNDIFSGLGKIDTKLQNWIKSHDASGIWGILIYGKNADGSSASAMDQLGTLFGGVNKWITDWLKDNAPAWLTSWGGIGDGLKKAWDGPDSFNWGSVGTYFSHVDEGVSSWLRENGPSWLTSWSGVGSKLRGAWDGPDSFNWGAVGKFFGGIASGIDSFISDHLPGWLTSWSGLGTDLESAWDGPSSFNWGAVGGFFGGIVTGIDSFISDHLPGWLTSWTGLGTDLEKAWNGPSSFNWGAVGGFFTGIASGIDKFATDHFPGWLTSWSQFASGLGNAFSGVGSLITGHLDPAAHIIGNFFSALGGGVHWLAKHFPGVQDVPDPPEIQSVSNGVQLGPPVPPGYAKGITNSPLPGHWAVVGENGPEPMYVPTGATIVPNDKAHDWGMLPGHALGLNFDFLGDAFGVVGKFITGSAQKAVDAILSKVGVPNIDVIPNLGKSLVDMAKNGLLGFLRPQEVSPDTSGLGGTLGPLISIIKKYAGQDGLPADIIGAVILHESGGIIGRVEVGGGLGRGLMQVDGGTWPQAYDPRMTGTSLDDADYQINIGSMILKRAFDAAGGDIGGALTGYAGTGFAKVHGRTFYQELQDMGLIAAADSALNGPVYAPGSGGGGFIWPVNGPITQGFGQTGFYLEPGGFHDGVDIGVGTGTRVMADANGMVGQAGDSGDGYGIKILINHANGITTWMGHNSQAIARLGQQVAQGDIVSLSGSTGASTGPHVHWGAHQNGNRIDPTTLLMQNGGVIREPVTGIGQKTGSVYKLAENGLPERVLSNSDTRAYDSGSTGGEGTTYVEVTFEAGSINVDNNGNPRVNRNAMTIRRSLIRNGVAG